MEHFPANDSATNPDMENPMDERVFQIHKDGKLIAEDATFHSLAQAAIVWKSNDPLNTYVVRVDIFGNVVERFSPADCEAARSKFLNLRISN